MSGEKAVAESIRALCKKALDATLELKDFYSLWPKEAGADAFFRQVFEDIEDGVEHTPGYFLKGGVDYESWCKSDMYLTLYIDYLLLSYDRSSSELLRTRQILLDSGTSDKEAIQRAAKACLID